MPDRFDKNELFQAVGKQNIEEVQRILNIPWDRVKRRRIENAGGSIPGENVEFTIATVAVMWCTAFARRGVGDDVFERSVEILKCLLQNGATSFPKKQSPFSFVGRAKNGPALKKIARVLVDNDVDLTVEPPSTLLSLAVEDHVQLMQYLCENGFPSVEFDWLLAAASYNGGCTLPFFKVLASHADPKVWTTLFTDSQISFQMYVDALMIPRNVRPEVIEYLRDWPLTKIKSTASTVPSSHVGEECSICCEKYTQGNDSENITTLRCGHVFHVECMLNVIRVNKDYRCPICRQVYL